MSDTPRTDAQGYGDGRHPYVPADFARQLERELDQARQQNEFHAKMDAEVGGLRAELEQARQDRNDARAERQAALSLVANIRFALGDNGLRMQDELVEWCKTLNPPTPAEIDDQ